MKLKPYFGFALFFILLVILFASFNLPNASANAIMAQGPTQETSQVGSTDGIMLMGVVICMIIIVPVLFHRKKK